MPRPAALTPRSSPREVLRGWQLPEPDRRQERPRLDPGDRRQRRDPRRGAAGRRGRAARRRGQAAGGDGRRRSRPSPPPPCPRRWCAALPETDGGAIRADAADAVRDLAEAADAVLIGPGMADKEETQDFGERACCRTCAGPLALDALGLACVTADAACLHHLDGRVVLTPEPD